MTLRIDKWTPITLYNNHPIANKIKPCLFDRSFGKTIKQTISYILLKMMEGIQMLIRYLVKNKISLC